MNKLWKVLRWTLIAVVCLFLFAQFLRPARTNPLVNPSQALESRAQVSPQVSAILDRSCNDCHSNKTRWPWYTNVAPVSWFVINHVNEARENLNFSEWGQYKPSDADGMLRQICKEVKAEDMPLSTYTPMHPGSKLSADDIKVLCDWTAAERARLFPQ